ncbi:MAG: hypothetical protein IJC84_04620 [Clostridia bacterium]|nr:hypothetical protein [Clostridia bacterium]
MKTFYHFSLLLLCGIMILSAASCGATKPETTQEDTEESMEPEENPSEVYSYEKVDGGITLTAYRGNKKILTVPSSIDNQKVVSIGKAFQGNIAIREITLPDSLNERYDLQTMFDNCEALEKITFMGNVTSFAASKKLPSLKSMVFYSLDFTKTGRYYHLDLGSISLQGVDVEIKKAKNYTPVSSYGETDNGISKTLHFTVPEEMVEQILNATVVKRDYYSFENQYEPNTAPPKVAADENLKISLAFRIKSIEVNGTLYEYKRNSQETGSITVTETVTQDDSNYEQETQTEEVITAEGPRPPLTIFDPQKSKK